MKKSILFTALLLAFSVNAQNTAITTKNTVTKDAGTLTFSGANRLCFVGSSSGSACLTMPAVASSSASIINGALGYIPANVVGPLQTPLPAPVFVSASGDTTGILAAGTYYVVWTAIDPGNGETLKSAEGTVTISAPDDGAGAIITSVTPIMGASYRVYVGISGPGSEDRFLPSDYPIYSFLDYVDANAGAPPSINTAYSLNIPGYATSFAVGSLVVGTTPASLISNSSVTSFGAGSISVNSSASYIAAFGAGAGASYTGGFGYSSFFGTYAGTDSVDGSYNTSVGTLSLQQIVHGSDNTAIGEGAGPGGDFSDTISVGESASPAADHHAVFGQFTVTDVYFGGEPDAASALHASDFFVGSTSLATGNVVASRLTGLGIGVAAFLATPSSTNLAAAVTGETGSGGLVFATSPTLVTPSLGVATATSMDATTLKQSGVSIGGSAFQAAVIRCVSSTLSGALTLGAVNTATATCTGATNTMAVACSYTADPGTLVAAPKCVVSSTNTVTVTESGLGIVTPTSTTVQIAVTP